MSLIGLAIIGRRNEPLYLCDCVRVLEEAKQRQRPVRRRRDDVETGGDRSNDESKSTDNLEDIGRSNVQQQEASKYNSDKDPFGFQEAAQSRELGQSLSFQHSLLLHSALDNLEERIETSGAGLPVVKKGRTGHWLGLLVSSADDDDGEGEEDECMIYGYITATNIKFLVLVRPPVPKETTVRMFLNVIHDSFISYTMNPFSSVKAGHRIQSRKFDSNIREAVRDYEDNRLQS
jgi:hypothetical protein